MKKMKTRTNKGRTKTGQTDRHPISLREAEYSADLLDGSSLCRIKKIGKLIKKVKSRLKSKNDESGALFELRIAGLFNDHVVNIEHELKTINNSSVDFYCEFKHKKWFIEAASIREAVKKSYNSEEQELNRMKWAIGKKPKKFNDPVKGHINIIVFDMRGFNYGVMENNDFRKVLFNLTKQTREKVHYIILVRERFAEEYDLESGRKTMPEYGNMFNRCFIARNEPLLDGKKHILPFKGFEEKEI